MLSIITVKDKEQWQHFFNSIDSAHKDIYYTSGYYELYERLGDGKAHCAVFESGNDIILYPFLLNSVNSLGYSLDSEYYDIQGVYGYNGIITNNDHPEFIKKFNKHFTDYCINNNIIAEFTRFNPLLSNSVYSHNQLMVIEDRKTVVIDLSFKYEELWDNSYSSKNRNMIRKAKKLNYSTNVLTSPGMKEIDSFIEVYNNSMKRVNAEKYFFFQSSYFHDIFNLLKNNVFLINVLDQKSEVCCAGIFFQCEKYFHYHLSGRSENADNSANNFLIDRAIDFAMKNGAAFFHLGGGRSSMLNDSLLKFKTDFSKQLLSFSIGKKIHNPPIYSQVISQWEKKYPEKVEAHEKILLKYRF